MNYMKSYIIELYNKASLVIMNSSAWMAFMYKPYGGERLMGIDVITDKATLLTGLYGYFINHGYRMDKRVAVYINGHIKSGTIFGISGNKLAGIFNRMEG